MATVSTALHPVSSGRMAPPVKIEKDRTGLPSLPVPYLFYSSMLQSLVVSYKQEFTSNPDQV